MPIPALQAEMFSEAANAGARGADFITRTWPTMNSAAWATPQVARVAASSQALPRVGTRASMPSAISRTNSRVAPSGLRSTRRPPSQLPSRPTAPKPISVQPTSEPLKPARRWRMSAR